MIAGSQSGKTSFGSWWLWNEIYGTNARGGGDYIVATSTYKLFKNKLLPEALNVFEKILGMGKYWPGDMMIELKDPLTGRFLAKRASDPMWGRIMLLSAQSHGALEAATAKAAWLDECGQDEFPYESWEAVNRRLALYQGRVLGTTTPYNLGWLKREVFDRAEAGDADYNVIQFPSHENPSFPMEEFERAKRTLPKWRFDMFYRGLFAKPEGLIYGCFNEDMIFDMAKKFGTDPINASYPRWVGVDFGGANTATIYLVEDIYQSPSVFYLFDEHLEGDLPSKEHAARVKERCVPYSTLYIGGGSPSETQMRNDWKAAGLEIPDPKISDVELGISNVIQCMQEGRLKISRSCSGILHEIGTYRRKSNAEGTISDSITDKNMYHRLDALRYVVNLMNTINVSQTTQAPALFAGHRG